MNDIRGWIGPDKLDYVAACLEAVNNDAAYCSFKRNNRYKAILEHVHGPMAQAYYDWLKPEYRKLVPLASQINDSVGNPIMESTPDGPVTGTTLRYLKVVQDLDELGFLGGEVVEIGAGYGGQARLILSLAKNKEAITSYTAIDLHAASLLQAKYNKDLPKFRAFPFGNLTKMTPTVVISNYAFSELSNTVQEEYLQKVILNATHGYITYNPCGDCGMSYDELFAKLKDKAFKEAPDLPQRNFVSTDNRIITW